MTEAKRSTRMRDLGLCTLAACLTFMAFPTALAPEWTFWPLIWVSHVPLFWLLKDKAPKQAFRWGLLCGTIINAGGYYWIADLLVTFGHLPYAVAFVGLMLHSDGHMALYQGMLAYIGPEAAALPGCLLVILASWAPVAIMQRQGIILKV